MLNLLTTVGALGALGVLTWFAFSREPHWSSRDGRRFIARAQVLDGTGHGRRRWREVRGRIDADGTIALVPRGFGSRDLARDWRIIGRGAELRHGRVVFVLRNEIEVALRIPVRSRAASVLSELIEK